MIQITVYEEHDSVHNPIFLEIPCSQQDSLEVSLSIIYLQNTINARQIIEHKILRQVPLREGWKMFLDTAPIRINSENWRNPNGPNFHWKATLSGPYAMGLPPKKLAKDIANPQDVSDSFSIFQYGNGARVRLKLEGCSPRIVTITSKRCEYLFRGLLARLPTLLEFRAEHWYYSDGTRMDPGTINVNQKSILLEIGHAFRCELGDNVLSFCIVQESAQTTNSITGYNGTYTPVYRVKKLTGPDEAERYVVQDAAEHGIGTIGSFVILKKGTRVEGLCCGEIGDMTIGM